MELPCLRCVESIVEVKNFLAQLKGINRAITLWQNTPYGRVGSSARITNIDLATQSISFEPVKGKFQFHSNLTLYFFSQKHFVLLKSHFYFNSNFKITIHLPDNIMAKEYREFERVQIAPHESRFWIRFNIDEPRHIGPNHYRAKIIDISDGGFCVHLSGYDVRKFKVGTRLSIHNLNAKSRINLISAKVTNLTLIKDSKAAGEWYRMGVAFGLPVQSKDVVEIRGL